MRQSDRIEMLTDRVPVLAATVDCALVRSTEKNVIEHRQRRDDSQLLVNTMEMSLGSVAMTEFQLMSVDGNLPSSGCTRLPRILMNVLLPAPFSPQSA